MLRIKELMKSKGYTGKELAEKLGITENSLSLIINKKRQPRYESLHEIAKALDCDIRELFESTKNGSENETDLFLKNDSGQFIKIGTIYKSIL